MPRDPANDNPKDKTARKRSLLALMAATLAGGAITYVSVSLFVLPTASDAARPYHISQYATARNIEILNTLTIAAQSDPALVIEPSDDPVRPSTFHSAQTAPRPIVGLTGDISPNWKDFLSGVEMTNPATLFPRTEWTAGRIRISFSGLSYDTCALTIAALPRPLLDFHDVELSAPDGAVLNLPLTYASAAVHCHGNVPLIISINPATKRS